jgi:hypothetical protein
MADKHNDQPIRPAESPSVENLHNELIRIHGFHPRLEQAKAIKTLAIDQIDLILIARTDWGKSMIWCVCQNHPVFQACPLLAYTLEYLSLSHLRACCVTVVQMNEGGWRRSMISLASAICCFNICSLTLQVLWIILFT